MLGMCEAVTLVCCCLKVEGRWAGPILDLIAKSSFFLIHWL